jgi:molybdate transport system regulatory protein
METMSASEAAALLHVSPKRAQFLARTGRVPAVRVGRRWLFPRRELEALLRRPPNGQPLPEPHRIDLSARNQLRGVVTDVTVEGLMAEIRVGIGDQELVAVITRSAAERLRLRSGDAVYAVIKSTEVMIGKG